MLGVSDKRLCNFVPYSLDFYSYISSNKNQRVLWLLKVVFRCQKHDVGLIDSYGRYPCESGNTSESGILDSVPLQLHQIVASEPKSCWEFNMTKTLRWEVAGEGEPDEKFPRKHCLKRLDWFALFYIDFETKRVEQGWKKDVSAKIEEKTPANFDRQVERIFQKLHRSQMCRSIWWSPL